MAKSRLGATDNMVPVQSSKELKKADPKELVTMTTRFLPQTRQELQQAAIFYQPANGEKASIQKVLQEAWELWKKAHPEVVAQFAKQPEK